MILGSCGRIGIIGGSVEYTGAPYFSAMAALYAGADLVYIFSHVEAAPIIKSYSPDLIVFPTFSSSKNVEIPRAFNRLSCLLVGPGLSKEEYILDQTLVFIKESIKRKIPLIVDADGIYLVSKYPNLFKNAILTPNAREFMNLLQELNISGDFSLEIACKKLECIILLKGEQDIISNGFQTVKVDEQGTIRRVGGLGDILSGITSTFISFLGSENTLKENTLKENALEQIKQACILTRKSCFKAFMKKKRAMRATDVLQEIDLEDIIQE